MLSFFLVSLLGLAGGLFIGIGNDDSDTDNPSSTEEEGGHADENVDIGGNSATNLLEMIAGPEAIEAVNLDADIVCDKGTDQDGLPLDDGAFVDPADKGFLYGTSDDDTLVGDDRDDSINGGDGDDNIWAWEGDNLIYGGNGDDEIHGGYRSGSMLEAHGGAGDDTFMDSDGDSDLYGGAGNDEFHVGSGHNVVHGGDGDDTVYDGQDTDMIHGGAGNDALYATGTRIEGEVDQVHGGSGDDVIDQRGEVETWGGEGSDLFRTYVNTWADTASTVMDFTPDEDRLEIQIEGHGYQYLDDFAVTTEDFEDGTGASVFVDGVEVLKVVGGQGLAVTDLGLTVVDTLHS